MTSGTALRALLFGVALMCVQEEEPGVSGLVLAPDGMPVSSGTVMMLPSAGRAAIDDAGRFRLVPNASGFRQVMVSVRGYAPYRFILEVPRSKAVRLPPIRLSPATYFRVRFVSMQANRSSPRSFAGNRSTSTVSS